MDPRYFEVSVFMEKVNNQNLCIFELGCQESMNVPMWNIVGFQQRDKQDSQDLYNDTFIDCQLLVLNAE